MINKYIRIVLTIKKNVSISNFNINIQHSDNFEVLVLMVKYSLIPLFRCLKDQTKKL